METIFDIVKKAEKNYTQGGVKLGKYLDNWNMYDLIEKINAYSNSAHISGKYDSLGREKPFFNIGTAAVNVWFRATDIDRKDIKFRATNSKNYIKSFIASILLRNWMRQQNFGQFLNRWGRTLAKYGSAVVKATEKDGELYLKVIFWDKLICDSVEFKDNIKIEKLFYTPIQLRKIKEYDQAEVEKAIKSLDTRETLTGEQKDTRNDYVGVYELHGELPLFYLTGKEKDKGKYRQQMHVLFIHNGTKKENYKDKIESTLYAGKEAKDFYFLTHLIEEEGKTLSIGAIEHLFDTQWMVNHSVKQIKDQLDIASKMVLQTADENFVGRNVLTNIETGQILVHADNRPLTQVNNQSHDMPAITSFLQLWQALGRDITGTPEAVTGNTMPSGTAYRQVAALQQEAHSLFELMTENKGLYLEEIIKNVVVPFFKKKLNNTKEVALVLESEELQRFDDLALPAELENELKRIGGTPTIEELTGNIQQRNAQLGMIRFVTPGATTWKEYFKDLEDDIEVVVTNENLNKETTMTTLTTVLQTIAQNPAILQAPVAKRLFAKILETTGEVSPIELQSMAIPQMPPTVLPQRSE